jgi:hypothetical protein
MNNPLQGAWIKVYAKIKGHNTYDFDKKPLREALKKAGQIVRDDARRLLARQGISAPGQYPGVQTGDSKRWLISRSGKFQDEIARIVEHKRSPRMNERKFYPAILTYGSEHIAPRENYIVDAAELRRNDVRRIIGEVFQRSIKPI